MRLRRMMIGMSQEALGGKLNLTFQQVQKYEKGANRIGASRLYTVASILDVPVQFFFEDMPDAANANVPVSIGSLPKETGYVMDFVSSREGLELNKAFSSVESAETRKAFLELVKAISEA